LKKYALKILPVALLPEYVKHVPKGLQKAFDALKDAELSTSSFSFYTSVSSVFSSKIEGEEIDLDSYIKHKRFNIEFLPDYTKKIDDLYGAYIFAQKNKLSEKNIAKAHQLLAKHLVAKHQQCKIRIHNMYVASPDGKIEYVAATPDIVPGEMKRFYQDIEYLISEELTIEEVLFFAATIHLVFVKIHPWNDGNGRSARLIEKWFLAQKLGKKSWFIQSEKYYYEQHQTYYKNIRKLGLKYAELDYSKGLPFLLMLSQSLYVKR
jgi:Fic family protein